MMPITMPAPLTVRCSAITRRMSSLAGMVQAAEFAGACGAAGAEIAIHKTIDRARIQPLRVEILPLVLALRMAGCSLPKIFAVSCLARELGHEGMARGQELNRHPSPR